MTTLSSHPLIPATRLARHRFSPLVALTALIALSWHQTFLDMWHRWFPAWGQTHLSLLGRLTQGDSYYGHAPLALAASVAVAWRIHRRTGWPARRTRAAAGVGSLLLCLCLSVHLLSLWAQITFTSGCALIGVIGGLLLLAGGWPLARAYLAPTLLLIFMVPMPMLWIAQVNLDLKLSMAHWATAWAQAVAGTVTTIQGSAVLIHSPNAPPQTLWIEDSCSGLRSLIAISWFAALFTAICQLHRCWRLVILAVALPAALLINAVRIALTLVLAKRLGVEAVADDTALHHWLGLGVFLSMIAVFILFERGVLAIGSWLGQQWHDRPGTRPDRMLDRPQLSRWVWTAMLATAFLAVAIGLGRERPTVTPWNPATINTHIQLNGERFLGRDLTLTDRFKSLLGTDRVLHRRYMNRTGTTVADLLLVNDPTGRRSIHPPQVCLQAIGSQITSEQNRSITLADGRSVEMRELIVRHGPLRICHLYAYRRTGQYTVSFIDQQFANIWGRFWHGTSNTSLVRVSVPDTTGSLDNTRRLTVQAAQRLLVQVEKTIDGSSERVTASASRRSAH